MKKATIFLLATLVLTACERGEVETPKFEVSVASNVVKAGTPVDFAISGHTDMVSFYSGESGNEYSHRLEDRIMENAMYITFGTTYTNGTNPSSIQFMWSSDFAGMDGAYTQADVESATWHDISDRFTWPKENKEGLIVPAGELDMSGFFPDEKTPVYLCYYYNVKAGQGICSYFNIQGFKINGVTPIGTEEAYTFGDCNWQVVLNKDSYSDVKSTYYPDVNTKRILMRSTKTANPVKDKEAWIVGGPFYKMSSLNMGPDRAVAIKANSDPMPSLYQYTFETPGEYTVTFVGINASVYGRKEVVREVRIKVVDDAGSVVSPSEGEWND